MDFAEAAETSVSAHVVGEWVMTEQAQYDPTTNLFTFYMKDRQGAVRQVHYADTKPASFEHAEKLVVEGHLEGNIFVAENILTKCPSKYNDERALQDAVSGAP